ncbi:MAG TPA: ABC transporter ATP-binding protein [Terriglobales bacterium]|nr:ABC transporter ATP-binding protein [Terriglobales bacterium]
MTRQDQVVSFDISIDYPGKTRVLDNVALEINRGEILGLVGQSGCGKSTLALALLRLIHLKQGRAHGSICLNGRELMECTESKMRAIRGKEIALVLQSPMSSLNPALQIGTQMQEAWRAHRRGTRYECDQAIRESLDSVSLPADSEFLRRYPSHLSVGQAQRVLIGMAVIHRPTLLIADEPTSALDVITQAEILTLFSDLSRRLSMSILFISHDLLSVASIAHRAAVMRQGTIVECRRTADIFRNPSHPYTQSLVRALPTLPLGLGHAAGKLS